MMEPSTTSFLRSSILKKHFCWKHALKFEYGLMQTFSIVKGDRQSFHAGTSMFSTCCPKNNVIQILRFRVETSLQLRIGRRNYLEILSLILHTIVNMRHDIDLGFDRTWIFTFRLSKLIYRGGTSDVDFHGYCLVEG